MIRRSPLAATLSVNAQAQCNCGCVTFQVGMAAPTGPEGSNFIRILECTDCGRQLLTIHAPDGLAPGIRKDAIKLDMENQT